MKPFFLFALPVVLVLSSPALSQTAPSNPASFRGATAEKSHYQAAYQLNTDDDAKIRGTLRNLRNALDDPRLKGKIEIELVVHGDGAVVYRKDKGYEGLVSELQQRGVILAMCENTMRMANISRDELFPFVSYVPSGNGELIIRQQQGWAVIHP